MLCWSEENWENTFISIQTADSAPSKPHPGMIQNAMSDGGIDAAIMVGDTSFDMEMVRGQANAHAYGVAWGYHDVPSLAKSGAHMILDDYKALTSALIAGWLTKFWGWDE